MLTEQKSSTKKLNKSMKIQYGITSMNGKEQEIMNLTSMCDNEVNKHKETLIMYGSEGKEKTSITFENK